MGNTSSSEQSYCGKRINFGTVWEKGQLLRCLSPSADGQWLIHYAEQQPAVILSAVADP